MSNGSSKVSWRERRRIWVLKEGRCVAYFPEDCRKGFTGYALFRELHSYCSEHHKLGDEEQWEIRLVRSVEVIVWRMSYAVFSRQPSRVLSSRARIFTFSLQENTSDSFKWDKV